MCGGKEQNSTLRQANLLKQNRTELEGLLLISFIDSCSVTVMMVKEMWTDPKPF